MVHNVNLAGGMEEITKAYKQQEEVVNFRNLEAYYKDQEIYFKNPSLPHKSTSHEKAPAPGPETKEAPRSKRRDQERPKQSINPRTQLHSSATLDAIRLPSDTESFQPVVCTFPGDLHPGKCKDQRKPHSVVSQSVTQDPARLGRWRRAFPSFHELGDFAFAGYDPRAPARPRWIRSTARVIIQ